MRGCTRVHPRNVSAGAPVRCAMAADSWGARLFRCTLPGDDEPDPHNAPSPSPVAHESGNLSDSSPESWRRWRRPRRVPAPAPGPAPVLGRQRHTQDIPATETKGGLSGGVWVSLILGAVITILLLVFIIQNNSTAQFQYFGWEFQLPLGVAMLLAAIAGVLVAGIIGSVRIFILSRRLKKVQKAIGG